MNSEKYLYFAYGSNMLSKRLNAKNRAQSARSIGYGYIDGYLLTFDKLSQDGSGKCDMVLSKNVTDRVYGAIYEIDKADKINLDKAEGLGHGYKESDIEVIISGKSIEVETYIATKKK